MDRDRLEASLDIDRASTDEVVRLIGEQDATVAQAVAAARPAITEAVEAIVETLRRSGRLFYVGAGTSGRIAMLDAAEVPPTYGVPHDRVQVIMAGGAGAFLAAAEGAEDDAEDGATQVRARVRPGDAVVGIAASGTTPFTVAAVREARELGCPTVAVTSAPGSPLAEAAEIAIVVETGPEVVMGSTRMKAGTAQKMVLNTLSTAAMVRLGRVYSNLMIDMPATNAKLRRRTVRMVELAAGVPTDVAEQAVEEADHVAKVAVVVAAKGVSAVAARELLAAHGGRLRAVLGQA